MRSESLGPSYTLVFNSVFCGYIPHVMDSTPEDEWMMFWCLFSPFIHSYQGLESVCMFSYWSRNCFTQFGQLIKRSCNYFLGYLWYDVYHCILFNFICYNVFYSCSLHLYGMISLKFDRQNTCFLMLCFGELIIACPFSSV